MITRLQKELIAIEVIKVLYSQIYDIAQVVNSRQFEIYANAFLESLSEDIFEWINLKSWMRGLNTSLGKSFFENVGQILCYGTKKEFTTRAKSLLKLNPSQKLKIANLITGLSNGDFNPDSVIDDEELLEILEDLEDSTGFTADIFFEDDTQIVCIELKTVKPNKGIFKVEKQKILEAKAALRLVNPTKQIKFFIGFPFDPLSKEPTGYDKQRFMDYSVDFRKYFAESEFLLSAELWDYLSGTTGTMEVILEIINSIATVEFFENFDFLQNRENAKNQREEYIDLLKKWYLFREVSIIKNQESIYSRIFPNNKLVRYFYEPMFKIERKEDECKTKYNEKRFFALSEYL